MEPAVDRVIAERRTRGWSIRRASQAGDISNQTWSIYERTGVLSDRMRQAVAAAFDWPSTWPETPVPPGVLPDQAVALSGRISQLEAEVETLRRQLLEVATVVRELGERTLLPDADEQPHRAESRTAR